MALRTSLPLLLCAQALSGYQQVFGRRNRVEGRKDKGESSTRDADGVWKESK